MLSKRACCDCHGQDSSYFIGWEEFEKYPYHHEKNPNGIIQMGLAENQLSLDLVESWLENHPEATGLEKGTSSFRELALFQDYRGLPAFKNALADFMTKVRRNKVKFDPSNLVLTAGATSANEILTFCLAEPGEAFLLPTPYYPGFDRDLKWRTGIEIIPIICKSSNGFKITLSALEEAFQRALKLGLKVKGILITNPSNPLGTTLTNQELDQIIHFIIQKGIHVISDEIYAGSVYDFPNFTSILEVTTLHKYPENVKLLASYVHLVCSLSKDLGLPGFRVGMIYSNNKTVVATATKMSSFGLISSQTQHLLSNMLSDYKFTSTYIVENQRRLLKRKENLIMGLENAKIKCLKSNAGLFCWVDMRHLLKSSTFEAEMDLWGTMLYEVGLNVSPGSSFHCSEPGWFRVCFSNINDATLDVALKRIKVFVDSIYDHYCEWSKPPLARPRP